ATPYRSRLNTGYGPAVILPAVALAALTADCPSGQRELTVNQPALAFEGSNPSSATEGLVTLGAPHTQQALILWHEGRSQSGIESSTLRIGPGGDVDELEVGHLPATHQNASIDNGFGERNRVCQEAPSLNPAYRLELSECLTTGHLPAHNLFGQ